LVSINVSHCTVRSRDFNDFVGVCLVKDPTHRSSTVDLLHHAFLQSATDSRPVVALLSEANAEITVETVDVEEISLDVSALFSFYNSLEVVLRALFFLKLFLKYSESTSWIIDPCTIQKCV